MGLLMNCQGFCLPQRGAKCEIFDQDSPLSIIFSLSRLSLFGISQSPKFLLRSQYELTTLKWRERLLTRDHTPALRKWSVRRYNQKIPLLNRFREKFHLIRATKGGENVHVPFSHNVRTTLFLYSFLGVPVADLDHRSLIPYRNSQYSLLSYAYPGQCPL